MRASLLWCVLMLGCSDDSAGGPDAGPVIVGTTTVALPLDEKQTRAKEALIGDLVADAYLEALAGMGAELALVNGGGLRCPPEFDATDCVDYVIPAGDLSEDQIDVVLKFNNDLIIKDMSGADLRSTLERSVSSIPSETKGWFLQIAGGTYAADCAQPAQVLNTDSTAIMTEGTRVTSVLVGGTPIVDTQMYKVAVNAFEGAGNDGHVAMAAAVCVGDPTCATTTGVAERTALRSYLAAHDPVTPTIEGRITLTAACAVP